MSLRTLVNRHTGGPIAALAIVLFATVCICFSVYSHGWQHGWRIWGVHTRDVPWLDLKVITSAVQTAAEGGDPYLANPHDPTGRTLNYPAPWLYIFSNIRSPGAIAAFSLGFAAAAVVTALLWMKSFGVRAGCLAGLLFVSPSLLLAVERGNTDLVIFTLTGLALLAVYSRHRLLSATGIPVLLAASVLKLYPVVALFLLAAAGPTTLRRSAQIAIVLFAVWIGLHWSETLVAIGNTQIGAVHSYGRKVLPFAIDLYSRSHGQTVDSALLTRLFTVLCVILVGLMSWLGFNLGKRSPFPASIAHPEIGWLTAALIYVLTFIAGFNFNYRLWFLLLSLAWLIPLAGSRHPAAIWARIALGSMVVLLFGSAVWWLPLVWFAQTASWTLFAAFTVLLATSATSWMETSLPFLRTPKRSAPAE